MTETNMKRDLSSRQAAFVETDADGNLVYTPKWTTGGGASSDNTSTTALNNGQTYTGTWELNAFPDVMVFLKSDQPGILRIEFSPDGINADTSIPITTHADQTETHVYVKGPRYFRVTFENDSGTNQTYLRLNCYFGTFNKLTSNYTGSLSHDFDALVTRSFGEEFNIGLGLVQGISLKNIFGRNPDVTTGGVPETIWMGGGDYTGHPTGSAEAVRLTSTDAGDTMDWVIEGLDANYEIQSETVTLTGTTPAVSVNTYRRVFNAYNDSATNNAGTITIQHNVTTANIFAVILAGVNQTQIAAYTVPANHNGYIKRIYSSLIKEGGATFDRDADINLMIRENGKVWRPLRPFGLSNAASYVMDIWGGISLPEKTDIKLQVVNVSNTTSISGGFDLVLGETL